MKKSSVFLGSSALLFLATVSPASAIEGDADDDRINFIGSENYEGWSATADTRDPLSTDEIFALYPDCAPYPALEDVVIGCPYLLDGVLYILQKDVPGEDVPAAEALTLTASDFQSLPLTPSTIVHQPAGAWTLVNVETIVYTDPAPQTLTTTVLGLPITVEATPVSFAWDFGDGSAPLVTTDAGAPYPGHTVSHTYTGEGTVTISLTTSWAGRFRIDGTGAWRPVNGTATTTSVAAPLRVEATETSLVP